MRIFGLYALVLCFLFDCGDWGRRGFVSGREGVEAGISLMMTYQEKKFVLAKTLVIKVAFQSRLER